MVKLGGGLLEGLLDFDSGHRGARVDCGGGHLAEFSDYREKTVDTVLGAVRLRRAYYHCADCGHGHFPKDEDLGVIGSSLSPGLRRMVDRVGSQEPFAHGSRDLAELAGLHLTSKRVERSSEADGAKIRVAIEAHSEAVVSGKVVPLLSSEPIPKLYVAIDGTGVPTVPADTEGHPGKSPDGRAHTREAKLGCLFTQTTLDEKGHPIRDPNSSSYVATMTTAAEFGPVLYAEALRRGCDRAQQLVVLGDGAPWIWNLADEHLPRSIQIVDYYHTLEHLHQLARLATPAGDEAAHEWLAARVSDLKRGDIEALLDAAQQVDAEAAQRLEINKASNYFEVNRERMRYARFRELGLFVGSGTVEAGCKSLVAQRLKQSGMRWTVRGAAAIISLRCQVASDRWEEVWEWLPRQTKAS
jgi:hypothetical protein